MKNTQSNSKKYSLDKNIGASLLRASANASSPHGYQSTFRLKYKYKNDKTDKVG